MADQIQPAMIPMNAQGQVAQPAQAPGPVALQVPAAQGGAQEPNQVLQGIPQVAAAAAGGLPAMPAAVRHRTFSALYNDTTCDPLWNAAATILPPKNCPVPLFSIILRNDPTLNSSCVRQYLWFQVYFDVIILG
jgi:hypothetical protein